MLNKNHLLLLFLCSISIVTRSQTTEVKYYNLVIDSVQFPTFLKDTSLKTLARISLVYDYDRSFEESFWTTLSRKKQVLTINKKIVDIKRETNLTFMAYFREYDETAQKFVNSGFEMTFSCVITAISEGHRSVFYDSKNSNYFRSFWYPDKNNYTGAEVILHWHLEPNKLQ